MPDSDAGKKLAENSFTLAEFLSRSPNYVPSPLKAEVLLQEHCHAKSVLRGKEEGKILSLMGVALHVPEAGCCGMAGAFGYESDKYDVSVACAERVLLPAVRASAPSTLLVADGFSCREQIEQLSGRKTLHLAELLHRAVIQSAVPESEPLHIESPRPFVNR
jgi:Fe-S oxidoreductase